MGMRDNGCGCTRNEVRGSYAQGRRDQNRTCGQNTVRQASSRHCGCDSAVRRQGRDLPDGCSCRGYDEPRMGYGQECCTLMHRLQELDFSIQEVVLYLDAYPDCCEAKSYYRQLVCEREKVAKAYEEQCGPLTAMGNDDAAEWKWCRTPWPWHPDFPGNTKA